MIEKNIYVYQGEGGIVTSFVKIPKTEYTEKIRLIADSGKFLTNGERKVRTIEVLPNEKMGWTEIDATEEDYKNELIARRQQLPNYKEMLDIITGETEE